MRTPLAERFSSYHDWLSSLEGYRGQIAGRHFFPPRSPGTLPPEDSGFTALLERLEIRPYRHQAQALSLIEAGHHLVVATPTASGKSLVYQLPILQAALEGATSLYLSPTKALARDQQEKLISLAARLELVEGIAGYDGDTPVAERRLLRSTSLVLLSNPDMLHYGILPYHHLWASFLKRLRYLVLDELHSYRGVMGIQVANILRRLRRLTDHYGSRPQVIAASATIGNPREHAGNLTGLDFAIVDRDEAPRAARELLFWRPPDRGEEGWRLSANTEAAWLATQLVRAGLQGIVFCNSRKAAELVRRYAGGRLHGEELAYLRSYRSGYTPEDRKLLEMGFKRGDIRVLTATSALELGVDIGGVDAVVMVGFPGSHMAFWQRAGRAGRGSGRALTLLIPGQDPLDEYYLNHQELLTEGRVENAVADPYNSEIHPLHLACAAAELPLRDGEEMISPYCDPGTIPGLMRRQGGWVQLGGAPHRRIAVRGRGGRRIVLKDGLGNILGGSDFGTALRELHPGAVYLHQGESYLVVRLDLEAGEARLLPHIEDYYTQPRFQTEVEVLATEAIHLGVVVGRVRVTTVVTGFVKKRYLTEVVLDERPLELPAESYPTQALWFSLTELERAVGTAKLPAAMHALEHALIGLLPAWVVCERADVGGVSYPRHPQLGEPLVFIYDGYPGGVGYARAGASVFREWLAATCELLNRCSCADGCPRCVLSPKCGNGNQFLDKDAAGILGGALLARLDRSPRSTGRGTSQSRR